MNKKNDTTTIVYGGLNLSSLLGILFIALKLTGVIQWSWLWVLCPFWIGFALFAAILAIFGVCIIVGIIANLLKK